MWKIPGVHLSEEVTVATVPRGFLPTPLGGGGPPILEGRRVLVGNFEKNP